MQWSKHSEAIVVAGAVATPHTQRLNTEEMSTSIQSRLALKTIDRDTRSRDLSLALLALHHSVAYCSVLVKWHRVLNIQVDVRRVFGTGPGD